MNPEMFSIPGPWTGQLAISKRPRGGDWLEDDVHGWRNAGTDIVVSLLDSSEEQDLQLRDEGRAAERKNIRFISFPIADRSVPNSLSDTVRLLNDLRAALESGKTVAVHCRQGIGRSALVAAGILVATGFDPRKAMQVVASSRGLAVPETPEQRDWVEKILVDHLALSRR